MSVGAARPPPPTYGLVALAFFMTMVAISVAGMVVMMVFIPFFIFILAFMQAVIPVSWLAVMSFMIIAAFSIVIAVLAPVIPIVIMLAIAGTIEKFREDAPIVVGCLGRRRAEQEDGSGG